VPVIHAWTVEIVQKMEHHSLANARMDILVNAAKYQVSIIFKNVLDVFFSLSIYIPERILLNWVLCFCEIEFSSFGGAIVRASAFRLWQVSCWYWKVKFKE
jgi:hypothetical protein